MVSIFFFCNQIMRLKSQTTSQNLAAMVAHHGCDWTGGQVGVGGGPGEAGLSITSSLLQISTLWEKKTIEAEER